MLYSLYAARYFAQTKKNINKRNIIYEVVGKRKQHHNYCDNKSEYKNLIAIILFTEQESVLFTAIS